jgi:hypothetical protein
MISPPLVFWRLLSAVAGRTPNAGLETAHEEASEMLLIRLHSCDNLVEASSSAKEAKANE